MIERILDTTIFHIVWFIRTHISYQVISASGDALMIASKVHDLADCTSMSLKTSISGFMTMVREA